MGRPSGAVLLGCLRIQNTARGSPLKGVTSHDLDHYSPGNFIKLAGSWDFHGDYLQLCGAHVSYQDIYCY